MKAKFNKPYSNLACLYDHIMRNIDYDEWAEYYIAIAEKYLKHGCLKNPRILELASGSCKMAAIMNRRFQNIITTDISCEMLKLNPEFSAPKVCCDMRQLPFKSEFDYIISAFDSINYILDEKELCSFFSGVHSLLSDRGIFSFDVSLESNSLKNAPLLNRRGNCKGINYIQESSYLKKERLHVNSFHLMYPDGREEYEVHKEKIYPFETFFQLLSETGFKITHCFDTFTFENATYSSDRIQFIVSRGKSDVKF